MTFTQDSGDSLPRVGRKVSLDETELRRLEATMERAPRRRGKGLLIALVLIIAVAVVLAGIWYYYWRPSGASAPEDAFLGMIDALNTADAEGVVSHMTANFADEDERALEIASLNTWLLTEGGITIAVISLTVIHRDMMGPPALEGLDDIVQWTEDKYQVEVDDSCAVEYTLTTTQGADSYTDDNVLPVVMIDSGWYVAVMPLPTGEVIIEPAP